LDENFVWLITTFDEVPLHSRPHTPLARRTCSQT